MSYLLFDLIAVALPAALLLYGARRRQVLLKPVGALALVALLWTAPWDEYLARSSVWTYDAASVVGQIGRVPVEEYAFVVLEVCLVGAWALWSGALPANRNSSRAAPARRRGALTWSAVGVLGVLLLVAGEHFRYLGLLLVWVAPPLALQQAVAGDVLAAHRAVRLRSCLPAALWLCVADRLALANGVWMISPATSTGWSILGLPVEEALFFLLTCWLITDGLLLATDPAVLRRAAALLHMPATSGLRTRWSRQSSPSEQRLRPAPR